MNGACAVCFVNGTACLLLVHVQNDFCRGMWSMLFVRLKGPFLRSTVWLTIPPRHPPSENRQNAYIQIAGDAAASKEITTQLAVVANTTCSTDHSYNVPDLHTQLMDRVLPNSSFARLEFWTVYVWGITLVWCC